MKYCIHCRSEIPEQRLRALPNVTTCTSCSSSVRYTAAMVIHHKTGNEVQVIKSAETAAELHRLSKRSGFASLTAMRSGKSNKLKRETVQRTVQRYIAKPDPKTFEWFGCRTLSVLDAKGVDEALKYVDEAVDERVITQLEGAKLKAIVSALGGTQLSTVVTSKSDEVVVSEEIQRAFREWKI